MPGGTGPDLAETLLKSRPELPVLYMSGYTDRTIDNARLGPRAAFLQKPVNLVLLATRVRSLIHAPREGRKSDS
jgi:FixJ family two-component response regulator